MTINDLLAALDRTAKAEKALVDANRALDKILAHMPYGIERSTEWTARRQTPEHKRLVAATVEQLGRVTVTATSGGNTRRWHVRHNFKIDGKRASRAEVEKLLG